MRAILLVAIASLVAGPPAAAGPAGKHPAPTSRPVMVVPGSGTVVRSTGSGPLAARETTGPDTFALYGGPDQPTEGKFQLVDGVTPDWGDGSGLPAGPYGGGAASWWPVDLTDEPVHWHRDTFNAENLNDNGPGNHALWSGEPAGVPQSQDWYDPPGYGNGWDDVVIYESAPLGDPSVGQVVSLDFFFNVDIYDVTWDWFFVEYDSAGTWTRVYEISASNQDDETLLFPAPGLQYSAQLPEPIVFAGDDYGGLDGDRIRIRFRATSDGAWSDEDGFAPTDAGLVQLDDITLTTSQGTFTEDFEGPGPYLFVPDRRPFAGDFADLYPGFVDLDPCRDANGPAAGFIDYGQEVRNGPVDSGPSTTGGSISPSFDYGIPGGYVVNYTGGVSFGPRALHNEIWSPEIYWDLPGGDDDAEEIRGVFLRFSVWAHLPLQNGIFYTWQVRSARANQIYTRWRKDTVSLFYSRGSDPTWNTVEFDVTNHVQYLAERVQVALGVLDYADVLFMPGDDATPSPVFDDFGLYKYRLGGPFLEAAVVDLAQDGFPVNGSIDASTPTARDALDVPFSMARDVNTGQLVNAPGDSVAFTAEARIPNAAIEDLRMVWALNTNPLFEDGLRAAPARAKDENVTAGAAGTVWTGEVVAQQCYTAQGAFVADRHFVDLPDEDFLYPGDVLHYYIQATDDDGRVTTLPADTSGFGDFGPGTAFDRSFTVRALPTLMDSAGSQPDILVVNDFGRRGGEADWLSVFDDMEFVEGEDFDTYTVQGPTSLVSNGIGSAHAHGATVDQVSGYHHMLYLAGDLGSGLLSDGSGTGGSDKGDDLGLLEAWHALPGGRNAAYFGDNIASALDLVPAAQVFRAQVLGVESLDDDVASLVGGRLAPHAVPVPGGLNAFDTDFVAAGGCPSIRHIDAIRPAAGAGAGHSWIGNGGLPMDGYQDPVASVVYPAATGIRVTLPFSISAIEDPGTPYIVPARSWLVSEILFELFGHDQASCIVGGGDWPECTDAPEVPRRAALSVAPNPFNPATVVEFTAALGSSGSVRIYNLRGELVRTLHRGEFRTQQFRWDGTDDRGVAVASGVYVVRADDGAVRETRKVALVR